MSFEFQSTLVNVTPNFRISGAQIGGVRILYNGDIKVARLVVTNDRDIQFALSGPYEAGDPDAIYAALSGDLYELTPGILINEGAISSIEMTAEQLIIDLEGSDLKYAFEPDAAVTAPVELNSHNYKLPPASFTALSAAAAIWRSSMDGTLEGLATTIATETADRISADAAIQADVDQNEADADAAMAAEIARVDALIASTPTKPASPLQLTTTVVWSTATPTAPFSTPTVERGIRLPRKLTCRPQSAVWLARQVPAKQPTTCLTGGLMFWKRTLRLQRQLLLAMPPRSPLRTGTPTPASAAW